MNKELIHLLTLSQEIEVAVKILEETAFFLKYYMPEAYPDVKKAIEDLRKSIVKIKQVNDEYFKKVHINLMERLEKFGQEVAPKVAKKLERENFK
mgnify:CR=1 FL=1